MSLIENPDFDFKITWGKQDTELKLFPAMKVSTAINAGTCTTAMRARPDTHSLIHRCECGWERCIPSQTLASSLENLSLTLSPHRDPDLSR